MKVRGDIQPSTHRKPSAASLVTRPDSPIALRPAKTFGRPPSVWLAAELGPEVVLDENMPNGEQPRW